MKRYRKVLEYQGKRTRKPGQYDPIRIEKLGMRTVNKMKKFSFFIISWLCVLSRLPAQEVGAAAVSSTEEASSSNWQNWVFAGSALIAVIIGITLVATNTGSSGHSHNHSEPSSQ